MNSNTDIMKKTRNSLTNQGEKLINRRRILNREKMGRIQKERWKSYKEE